MTRPILPAALLPVLFWMVFAAASLWHGAHGVAVDTDSQMRLAEVRDLLHGQGWSDTAQHRMNVPFGLPMHWSRLTDAPIALLMRLGGEAFALAAWPLLLFLAALFPVARIARAAGGVNPSLMGREITLRPAPG